MGRCPMTKIFLLLFFLCCRLSASKHLLVETEEANPKQASGDNLLKNLTACCRMLEGIDDPEEEPEPKSKSKNKKSKSLEKTCVDFNGKTWKAGEEWEEGGCGCWDEGCEKGCPVFSCTCREVDNCEEISEFESALRDDDGEVVDHFTEPNPIYE